MLNEPIDSWVISIGVTERDAIDLGDYVSLDVPEELRGESLKLLEIMIKKCKPNPECSPIQKEWHLLEDAYVAYRQKKPTLFWPRYQIKVFNTLSNLK